MTIADQIRRAKTDYDDVRNAGYTEGCGKGTGEGYYDGLDDGNTAGYDQGFKEGYDDGRTDGLDEGYDEGYDKGYADGVAGSAVTFERDDSTAYIKTVPNNAEPKAMLMSVGGMTYKCKNLSTPDNLIEADNSVVGGKKIYMRQLINLPEGDYTISFSKNVYLLGWSSNISRKTSSTTTNLQVFTKTDNAEGYISFRDGTSSNTEWDGSITVMLNEGTTALPYEPYYEGFRNSKITEIVNRGTNLFDEKQITHTANRSGTQTDYGFVANGVLTARLGAWGDVCEWHPFGVELEAGSYILSADCFIPTGGAPNLSIALGLGTQQITTISAYNRWERIKVTVNITSAKKYYVQLQGVGDGTMYRNMDVRFKNIQVQRGSTATEYTPYREPITKIIPEEIQALEGYGEGISKEFHNYIDYEGRLFLKKTVRKVFDGTEEWLPGVTDATDKYRLYVNMDTNVITPPDSSSMPLLMCNLYRVINTTEVWLRIKGISLSDGKLFVYDEDYNTYDTSLWKAHLAELYAAGTPLIVEYAIEESIATDISAYLADFDNILDVERGGSLEFVNEYKHAVPSSILYTKKVGT